MLKATIVINGQETVVTGLAAAIAHKVVEHIEDLHKLEKLKGQIKINHAPGVMRWEGPWIDDPFRYNATVVDQNDR